MRRSSITFRGFRPSRFVLGLAFLSVLASAAPSHAVLVEGDQAFGFSGVDMSGNVVDIRPLIGKQIVVLKFGSIYCSSCVQSIVDFSALQDRHPPTELQVVEINLDIYGAIRAKRFYKGYQGKINFPVMMDEALNVSRQYGITTLPSIVIIGRDGKIARVMVGYDQAELKPTLEMVSRLVQAKPGEEQGILGPRVERRFQVVFPLTFTKTLQDSMYVVGKATRPPLKVALTLNGGSRQELTANRGFFYFRTPLSLGSNFIEVSLVDSQTEKVSQAVVIFRDPEMGQGFQVPFPVYRFHLEENEKQCGACHEVNPQVDAQNFMAVTQGCTMCHKEISRKSFVHGPITVGGCSPCHDFGSLPARYQLFTTGADLCYNCHEEKRNEFSRSYIHGPLAAGVCTICHTPHTSNEKFQLRYPQDQLCFMCHQQMKPLTFEPTLHKPFRDGACSGCHDPHSSENPTFFLKGVGDELCRLCHPEDSMTAHRHPVGSVPTYTFPEMKLKEDGTTTCGSCHSPHASKGEKLLPEGGCPRCHSI